MYTNSVVFESLFISFVVVRQQKSHGQYLKCKKIKRIGIIFFRSTLLYDYIYITCHLLRVKSMKTDIFNFYQLVNELFDTILGCECPPYNAFTSDSMLHWDTHVHLCFQKVYSSWPPILS